MIIFHIDANSAYLSWEAANQLQNGATLDLRTVPAVIGGDASKRRGIVLTKSIPAKAYGVQTGESLFEARKKCPDLIVVPPNYDLYLSCSNAMVAILREYSDLVERYSVDECFVDITGSIKLLGHPVDIGLQIKERIKKELGFTVNIGVSTNKLLAKMGSELKKPDKLHTLFPCEISQKLWPLPVEELFMVGRATSRKLRKININTIGDLAHTPIEHLTSLLKSHGKLIYNYANGIDYSAVHNTSEPLQKGIGNSTTISFDVTTSKEAYLILLALTEKVATRLRASHALCQVISVSIRESDFKHYSHQRKLLSPTDHTSEIYTVIKQLFDSAWTGSPVRHLGVRVSELCNNEFYQCSLFDEKFKYKNQKLDQAIDQIREKHGTYAIHRSTFLHSHIKPVQGGVSEQDYPMMSSLL